MLLTSWKPQKGKAYENLPAKILNTFDATEYLVSTKYDGNQIFIVKFDNLARFFTSDWKEFNIELVAKELENIPGNFILIGEFMHGCEGKLGDRRHSAILTTYRTNFSKGIANLGLSQNKTNIKVFDAIQILFGKLMTLVPYKDRLVFANSITENLSYLTTIETQRMSGREARVFLKSQVAKGWEGYMLVEPNTYYHQGKRVNHSIKLKSRKTIDLLCIGIDLGEGKYLGMIGALVLQDSKGRIVKVGSGLDDHDRIKSSDAFIGKVIEIEYEQLMDTYIQPTYIRVRKDKEEYD